MSEDIFWLDKWNGNAIGGFFVRNDLFKFFEKCEKAGLKIVGIKKPNDWNLEIICEKNEAFEKRYEKQSKKEEVK